MKFGSQENINIVWCKMCFNILNRLGMAHKYDRQTDITGISNSVV